METVAVTMSLNFNRSPYEVTAKTSTTVTMDARQYECVILELVQVFLRALTFF